MSRTIRVVAETSGEEWLSGPQAARLLGIQLHTLPRFVADEYAELLESRPNDPDAHVFVTETGRPIGLRNFRRRLDLAAARTRLPESFTPYTLRHTCASLMAQQGVPVTTATAIMGHDPAMFLRVYSHLYPGDMRSAAAMLDNARTTELDRSRTSRGADVVQALRSGADSHSAGG